MTFIMGENNVAKNEKKNQYWFSYSKSMANTESFYWNIPSNINLLILKSASSMHINII